MRQHKAILLILAATLAAGTAFASAESESAPAEDSANGAEVMPAEQIWETVTLTGTVGFTDLPHPELTVDGTIYELMVPPIPGLSVESGDTITVEGILVDGRTDTDGQLLKVVSAVVDGEEYTVPTRMMGSRGSRQNGQTDGPSRGRQPGSRGSFEGRRSAPQQRRF